LRQNYGNFIVMSNQFIGLYDNPNFNQGTTFGFSHKLEARVEDAELHEWFMQRGYAVYVEPRSVMKKEELDGSTWMISSYVETPRVEPPEKRTAHRHLYIEPPLRNEHIAPLAKKLGSLSSIEIGLGYNYFIDNRGIEPENLEQSSGVVISRWH
jgi:hypothetical protein